MMQRALDLTYEQPAEDRLITLLTRQVSLPVARTQADQEESVEKYREQWRGKIARHILFLLSVVVVATFLYIIWLTTFLEDQTTDTLITVIQTVGTTLMTPLIGLIGAVVGFYYGGQTATQAASQTTRTAAEAASQTRETVSQIQSSGSEEQ